jgi:hypothetical protein
MRRTAIGLAALLAATPAAAQVQYWLPNGPGGTTYNNPQGSLSGTYYEHALRRHADQHRWARERGQQAGVGSGGAPAAIGADPSFRLANAGGRVIREVYVSAATDRGWGQDRLGRDVLQPGQRLIVSLPPGQCVNDIRVIFADGQAQERRQVNTCALTDMNFR